MVPKLPEKESNNPLLAGFWTARKWFTFIILLLLAWICFYVVAHSERGYRGYEYTKLSNDQILQVSRILTAKPVELPQRDTIVIKSQGKDSAALTSVVMDARPGNTEAGCDAACRSEKAYLYIKSQFEQINDDQLQTIRQYLYTFNAEEIGGYLADYKIRSKSYFWLTGSMVYAEIVFWAIAGVICSILFAMGTISRHDAANAYFDRREIPYQVAKFFYAPILALIIIFAYNYFRGGEALKVQATEGVIVFGFIAGFYAGRVMNFLNNLKDLVLPVSSEDRSVPATAPPAPTPAVAPEAVVTKQQAYATPVVPEAKQEQPKPQPQAPLPNEEQKPVVEEKENIPPPPVPKPPTPPVIPSTFNDVTAKTTRAQRETRREQAASVKEPPDYSSHLPVTYEPGETDIKEVEIDLKLDTHGLFEEEKNELLAVGFNKAVVTLHNVNGKDIITAKRASERSVSEFVATNVKPGIYIARATLSQRLGDDYIINLFGEKTAYITIDKPGLELYIKKYESLD